MRVYHRSITDDVLPDPSSLFRVKVKAPLGGLHKLQIASEAYTSFHNSSWSNGECNFTFRDRNDAVMFKLANGGF